MLNADVTAGHRAATLVHLANIGARTGRTLHFDGQAESSRATPEAAATAHPPLPRGPLGGAQGRSRSLSRLCVHGHYSRVAACD